MSSKKTIIKKTAGGIVVRLKKRPEVLVIHRPKFDDWTHPKGHLDPGESAKQAAIREVEEETGIVSALGPELSTVEFSIKANRIKHVRYWLMTLPAKTKATGVPNKEVDEARWLTPKRAKKLLTYDRDKALVDEAIAALGTIKAAKLAHPSTKDLLGEDSVLDTKLHKGVLVSRINSGKGNPLSPAVLAQLNADLDRCEQSEDITAWAILGQDGLLSGGFDLSIMMKGNQREISELVHSGGQFFARMYASEIPIVVGATGHAMAGGALMLLAADTRIGPNGPVKIGLNEVSIGMVLPHWALTLAAERITPRHLQQATATARIYDAQGATDAGFLDLLADPEQLEAAVVTEAERLGALDSEAYAATIGIVRKAAIEQLEMNLTIDQAFIDSLDA